MKRVKNYEACDFNSTETSSSLDLRKSGKVTPIKNQGPCGSCWAFSATASVESSYLSVYNKSINLSEQELVDCAEGYGCNGGWIDKALNYYIKDGVSTECQYPYRAKDQDCQPKGKKHFIKKYCKVTPPNEEGMKQALNQYETALAVIIGIRDINQFRYYE